MEWKNEQRRMESDEGSVICVFMNGLHVKMVKRMSELEQVIKWKEANEKGD